MNKGGQIWIETVIYVLIGLTITAILLSVATPQIQKMRERATIRQTINALNELNNEIQKVGQTPGNVKIVFFKISKGKLDINPISDQIIYTLDNSVLEFSESGIEIKEGDLTLKTEKVGKRFNIFLELNYGAVNDQPSKLNLLYDGNEDNIKSLHSALHKIQIQNLGGDIEEPVKIDFKVV